ncbi:MAG: YihA family ribosome biogenesis GTP-binding protein [Proteobacteria bacterium]|nr:YihA family ribosome biogenesis GTP-binding protein [Pseudomonadota bacterium]
MQKTYPDQDYNAARYTLSAARLAQLPEDSGFEVAFAGRSNAGKSSAVNALTRQNKLARTSKTPGRTQQIVIFEMNNNRRLMDLPGYGYAKVPEALRKDWKQLMAEYFAIRKSLQGVVLLMDVRHPMKPFDEQMLVWSVRNMIPCHILLTKADKLKRGPAQAALLKLKRNLPELASAQLFSAKTRDGVGPLIEKLNGWLQLPYEK